MMPVFGLYTYIRANRIRSLFLIGALFALIYVLTFAGALAAEALQAGDLPLDRILARAVGDLGSAFPIVTLVTVVWVFFSYRFNQSIIGLALSANAVTRQQEPKLYSLLENLCISRGVTTPRLEILETDVPNAYATGVNDKQYTITVTRGLMNLLDDQEMESVLAHELTHIRNGDVKMMIVAMVVAGVVAFFAEMFFRMSLSGRWSSSSSSSGSSDSREKGKGGGAVAALAIVAMIVAAAWVLSLMIRLALSRSREFLADAGSVELTKNPDAMISALRKIDGKGEIRNAPSGIMEMCLDNPRSGFADLFSTHPPIEARIAALKNYAGGREEIVDNSQSPAAAPPVPPEPAAPPQERRRGPWG
ncbi:MULTISPECIES: M48 family metallopeptidase [unclassified Beijerinckia]|uniref:M48 family metallopeptidase n=1 Tax=unclassified Beijerinckia TaxID=2638183 RepID=UPI00089CF80E|nr:MULTISPECIES: M48 family metallopeptidase [unclassified Beijerinckia]MDH7799762.1 heat shock protein HtpX [Beijerinckia sp. GAS462]SED36441.1 Heat shock protein. Metallo peptidase. MEROPS family M48B [Beijerinckia sp. 28-YEA-48]